MALAARRKRPWQVLAGAKQMFEEEDHLSWFRIKYWLSSTASMDQAFRDAGIIFFIHKFHHALRLGDHSTWGWRASETFKNPTYRKMFSDCFPHGDLLRILGMGRFEIEVSRRMGNLAAMRFEAEFGKSRFVCIVRDGDHRLETAERHFQLNRNRRISYGLTKAQEDRRFAGKMAYLTAASWTLPKLFEISQNILLDLSGETPGVQDFRLWCMQVVALTELFQGEDIELAQWVDCEPGGLPGLETMPQAKPNRTKRRAAPETKAGKASRAAAIRPKALSN